MANKKAKVILITVVSNSSGRVAHFTVDGKADSKRFPVETTDAELRKQLGSVKAGKSDEGKGDEPDPEIKALQEEAKELGVKGYAIMKKKETLLAKIAEAKAEADKGDEGNE